MKSKNIFRILLVATVLTIGITGCQKEDPIDPGTTTLDRDKFLGTWKVIAQSSVFGAQNWQMTISASNSSQTGVLITNFDAQSGTTTIASVSGNTLTVASQVIGSETVAGSVSYNSNGSLSLNYTADDGQTVDHVTGTATK